MAIKEATADLIKLQASLKSMGENDAANELGKKILASLNKGKDGFLFDKVYDVQSIDYKDFSALMDAAFMATCLEEVYKTFKEVTGGSTAEYWFKDGANDANLHRFFTFLARNDKRIDINADVPILIAAVKALKAGASYKIPSGLGKYDVNRFLNGLVCGEIRVSKEGIR